MSRLTGKVAVVTGAALATDPALMRRSGGTFIAAELAAEYGITDIDGRTVPSMREQRGAPIRGPI